MIDVYGSDFLYEHKINYFMYLILNTNKFYPTKISSPELLLLLLLSVETNCF